MRHSARRSAKGKRIYEMAKERSMRAAEGTSGVCRLVDEREACVPEPVPGAIFVHGIALVSTTMALKLALRRDDPLNTLFLPSDGSPHYAVATTCKQRHRTGKGAMTTTITREDSRGESVQVGVVEWPGSGSGAGTTTGAGTADNHPTVIVGTRTIALTKTGIYTSCVHAIVRLVASPA